MSKLFDISDFPAVIAATDVKQLRLLDTAAARSRFMRGYLGFDDTAQFALQTLIKSLSNKGGAYFINGVFGSGKSHLLGILTLLGDGLGHTDFLHAHPQFTLQLSALPPRFTVYFSLDEYDGSRLSLEEITWREIALRAAELNFQIDPFDATTSASRSEQFLVLQEKLQQQGYCGLQLCVDELSLFLGAKDHRSLQSEASWLQFLGQRTFRESTFSLWCCFALQKEWHDVGDLEPYSLSQVRDRFQTLTLSMAHLPSLIKHRLIHRKNTDAIHQTCLQSYNEFCRTWSRIDFGIVEWEELFPFHPATIELLEQVSSRFFSRTRSAALFCNSALKRYIQENPTSARRIVPSQIFDYFQPEFSQYAELKELDKVWRVWNDTIPRLSSDKTEIELYITLLKTLLLFRLSGRDITCIELANTLHENLDLSVEDHYYYIHQLLVRWCKKGDHLSLERGETWQSDRFSVTLGQSIQQTVRRHTQRTLETLQSKDARIVAHLLETCGDSVFPLNILQTGAKQIAIDWHNSPRQTEVSLWKQNSASQLLNQLLNWKQCDHVDVYLFLKVPFTEVLFPDLSEVSQRNRAALLLWQPRKPTTDEWEFAKESTARLILQHDPALRDNRRGRAVIKFLERDLKERARDLQHLMLRLYCEGSLTSGDRRHIDISELCHQRTWDVLIPTISSFALEAVYPRFSTVSPAVKVLSPSHVNQLGNRLLQQNGTDLWWPASMDRPVRGIAVPLGLAAEDKGRWRYAIGKSDLIVNIENTIGSNSLPIAALETHFAASPWGLLPSQVHLLLCGMIGSGQLEAMDSHENMLLPAQIKMPLTRAVHSVRRSAMVGKEIWNRVCDVIEILCKHEPLGLSFSSQMRAAQLLRAWRENTIAEVELTSARLRQLQNAIDDSPAMWKNTTHVVENVEVLLQELSSPDSFTLLGTTAALDKNLTTTVWQSWRKLQDALDSNVTSLLQLMRTLSNPQLEPPRQMMERRNTLLYQFREGEKVLFNTQLLNDARAWEMDFQQQYSLWHQQQFAGQNWQKLRHFSYQSIFEAFAKLASVKRYPFPEHLQLQAELQNILHQQCPRDGNLLSGEIWCNHCQLRIGQVIALPNLAEFSERIMHATRQIVDLLHSDAIHEYLRKSEAGRNLLHWDGEAETLILRLTTPSLTALEEALLPRRQFRRSIESLRAAFGNGDTRAGLERAFMQWLESNDTIRAEDEVIIDP